VVRKAKAMAAQQGITLAAFVERALARETRASRPASARLSEIVRDIQWYEANRASLLERHEDEYLAIVERQVVDHDADLDALASRVTARYGARSVFMPRCERSPRVVAVRSPRITPAPVR
jgi:hypothetical protein